MTCVLDDPIQVREEDWLKPDWRPLSNEYLSSRVGEIGERAATLCLVRRQSHKPLQLRSSQLERTVFEAVEQLDMRDLLFQALANRWKEETMFSSSESEILGNPAVRAIMAMGKPAIRMILNDLKQNGEGNWFGVLASVAGTNPIPRSIQGNTERTKEAWLEWGRRHHYL